MGLNRILMCVGVPFLFCVVLPSVIGALIIGESVTTNQIVYAVVGGMIVIAFPSSIILSWFVTKPKTKNIINP